MLPLIQCVGAGNSQRHVQETRLTNVWVVTLRQQGDNSATLPGISPLFTDGHIKDKMHNKRETKDCIQCVTTKGCQTKAAAYIKVFYHHTDVG